jgi:hypothetical protein
VKNARQESLLLGRDATPLLHGGPCIEALWDEDDADDPANVTCPHCLAQRARPKKLTWAQERRSTRKQDTATVGAADRSGHMVNRSDGREGQEPHEKIS